MDFPLAAARFEKMKLPLGGASDLRITQHTRQPTWRTATGTLAQAAQPRTKAGDLRTQRAGAAEEETARVRRSWTH